MTAEQAAKVSPLDHLVAGGWSGCIPGERLGVHEVRFVPQINVRVTAGSPARAAVTAALGFGLPEVPDTVVTDADGLRAALWLGPDEWLVVGPAATGVGDLESRLREAVGADWGSVVDVSSNRTVIEVGGPRARDLLARGCSLDMHPRRFGPGWCAQTLIARAGVTLWQKDHRPTFWLFVRASFAAYLAEWIVDAVEGMPSEEA